jgi:hypothetical protein
VCDEKGEPGLGDRDVEGRWVGNTRQWSHEDKGTKGLKEKIRRGNHFPLKVNGLLNLAFYDFSTL